MYRIIAFAKWCQSLPLPEMAAHLRDAGVDGVDLPCRSGSPINAANATEKLPEAKRIFEDHGLALDTIVSGIAEVDETTERQLEAFRGVGITKIRLGGYSVPRDRLHDVQGVLDETRRKLTAIEELLRKHGVRGAIQNHSGMTLDVNVSSCLLVMQDCDPEWVGVQLDPGHLTLSGEPLDLAIGLLGPRLHSVNFKSPRQEYFVDAKTGRLRFQPIWVPLRDGMVDVPHALAALRSAGYDDAISIHGEYRTHYHYIETNLEKTGQLIATDVAYLRAVMGELPDA